MARTADTLVTGKPAKKPVVTAPVAQPVPKTATKVATTNNKPRMDAARRSQARRRRQLARTVRRFESMLTKVPKPEFAARTGGSFRQFGATAWHPSKLFSLALLLGVAVAISYLQTDLRWFIYRETVQIDGATYVNVDELYQTASIDSWNIFWLRPQAIRERLSALPHVEDAYVNIDLPNQVVITVQEEQPVALWVTNEETLWLMPDGSALPVQNEQFAALPQIIDPEREAQAVTQPTRPAIDTGVLASALALTQKLPGIPQLRYNADYGLNFNLPNSLTWVYWGDGQDLDAKFTNLAAAQALIQEGQVTPVLIDVRYERPYIR